MLLIEVYKEASAFIGTYHSIQQTDGDPYLLIDIKKNQERYVEAIVLLHLNPRLSAMRLSRALGLPFDQRRLDILAGFYVRDEMNNGKRSGNEILSGRQMRRRINRECFQLNDIDYESDL